MSETLINWPDADPIDQKTLEKVSILLSGQGHLLRLIFSPSKAQLADTAENIKKHASYLSSGEYLLVLLALDLWDGSGEVLFKDVFMELDYSYLKKAIDAFV